MSEELRKIAFLLEEKAKEWETSPSQAKNDLVFLLEELVAVIREALKP